MKGEMKGGLVKRIRFWYRGEGVGGGGGIQNVYIYDILVNIQSTV